MSGFVDLHLLLAGSRPAAQAVARRDGAAIDFGQFQRMVTGWRAAFATEPGERFALYFEDTVDFATALFGAWHAGKCAVLPGDALPATVDRLVRYVDGFAGDLPANCKPLAPLMRNSDAFSPLDPQAAQLIVYTSGSSGEPLAIVKRLDQLFSEVRALEQAFAGRLGADTEVLATVSHQHIYGLLFRVLWPLAAGRVLHAERLHYLEDLTPALQACGTAQLVASPAHLKRVPSELRPDARLRAVFSSGGPLPDDAPAACIAHLGLAPIEVYGSSETGGVAWRQRSAPNAAGWAPLPGVQWRLQDETLEIRSAHLDTADWTATQDRAAPTPVGFTLLGRVDRVVKIEEKRVSLAAIEQALLASGFVHELRVVALPGPREQLGIVAVLNEAGWALHDEVGKKAFALDLRARLLQQLDASSAPRHWRFVSALPSNSQGKTPQAVLQALFDPRRPQPRVLEATPTQASLRIVADAALPQFDGHFPTHPVLPGVAQLEWAILLGRELFPALPPRFLALEGLKFQQVIKPGMAVTLSLEFKPEAGRLAFKYSSARGQHASGRVLFGPA